MKAKYNKTTISLAIPAILSEQIAFKRKQPAVNTTLKLRAPFDLLSSDAYIKKYGKDAYNKKLNKLSDEIAESIFNSKETWQRWFSNILLGRVGDRPGQALTAIKKIRDAKHFEQVQTKFKKLSGGMGIGQFISAYLGWKWSAFQQIEGVDWNPKETINYGNAIIKQLKKIKANPETIDIINTRIVDASASLKYGGTPYKTAADISSGDFWKKYKHEITQAAAIGALFIPVPGLNVAISTSLGLADAKMYWDEGDRYSAGFMALLSILTSGAGAAGAKYGLNAIIKAMGKKNVAKFIAKMKIIYSGGKQVLTAIEQELIKLLSQRQKTFLELAKEYIEKFTKSKTAQQGGKITSGIAKQYAAIVAAEKAWDPIYVKAGLQLADIQDASKPLLQQIKNKVIKNNGAALSVESSSSNTKLKQIIFEEYGKLLLEATSPFKTLEDSNRFRNWIHINKHQQAKQMDVDLTGPLDSPQLIQAYNTFKNEYNSWLKISGYKPIEEIPQEGDGEIGLSDAMEVIIFLQILAYIGSGVLGFFGVKWAAKKMIAKWAKQKILGNPAKIQQVIKTAKDASPEELAAMVKKIEPNAVLTSADEEAIRKAVNNQGLTTVMITMNRNQAIKDFIKHGGRTTGTFKGREIIALLTDAERAEFGEYILRYEKYMQFTEI